jgi:aspartate kinase
LKYRNGLAGFREREQGLLETPRSSVDHSRIVVHSKVAKVSAVGVRMRSHAGVAATMFVALAERGIDIQAISTSEIEISVLTDGGETELAMRVLHTVYGLDAKDGGDLAA